MHALSQRVPASRSNFLVALSLVFAVFLWGASNAGSKYLIAGQAAWPPMWTGGPRFFCAGLLLLSVTRWTRWLAVVWVAIQASSYDFPESDISPASWSPILRELVVVGLIFTCLFPQVYRYLRVSGPVERQQTKWVIFGLMATLVILILVSVPPVFNPSLGEQGMLYELILEFVSFWIVLLVPLTFGIAILRHRLFDIDVIINRTLVYGSLTVMLGLVYFGSVASLQYALRVLTGHEEQPQLAIVVSTLVIASLFNPLRRRIQSFIDRRFYRRKYDAAKTLEAFGSRLRDETDLGTLRDDLIGIIRETMQPEHVMGVPVQGRHRCRQA